MRKLLALALLATAPFFGCSGEPAADQDVVSTTTAERPVAADLAAQYDAHIADIGTTCGISRKDAEVVLEQMYPEMPDEASRRLRWSQPTADEVVAEPGAICPKMRKLIRTINQPEAKLAVDTSWRVVEESTITISGRTLPAKRRPTLKIDGQRVEVDAQGNFSHPVGLKVGKQRITLTVTAPGYRLARRSIGVTRRLSEAEKAAKEEARKAKIRDGARSISFDELNKAPDKYIGESVVFRGQVFQISESDGVTVILLSVTDEGYGFWTDEIMVTFVGSTPAVEEDIITVYGTAMGAESYDTMIGGTNTVPSVVADLVEMTG